MNASLEKTVVPPAWSWTRERNGPRTWWQVAECFWWVLPAVVLILVAFVG